MSRQKIEAISNLIEACVSLGASYSPEKITLADKTEIPLKEVIFNWRFKKGPLEYLVPQSISVHRLKVVLLEMQLKIIKENID